MCLRLLTGWVVIRVEVPVDDVAVPVDDVVVSVSDAVMPIDTVYCLMM